MVELMIALAIVGLLFAFAYPSYIEYVRTSRRVDAQQYLVQQAALMERNFARLNRYPVVEDVTLKQDEFYRFSYTPSERSFILSATPQSDQGDDECGVMSVNELGQTTASLSTCWR